MIDYAAHPDWLSVPAWAAAHGMGVRTAWGWIGDGRIAKKHVRRRSGRTWVHARALSLAPAPQGRGQRAEAYGLSGK